MLDDAEQPLEALGKPVRVNPGTHRVRVHAADEPRPAAREFAIAEREHPTFEMTWPKSERIASSEPVATPPSMPSVLEDKRSSSSARTWVLIGESSLALVGLGAGVGFTLAANGKADDAQRLRRQISADTAGENQCVNSTSSECQRLVDTVREQRRYTDIAITGYVAGGVLALAAAGTWLFWKPREHAGVAVVPHLAPLAHGALWGAMGSF
jgi:hypothetical protein